jgi:hypothetical protein
MKLKYIKPDDADQAFAEAIQKINSLDATWLSRQRNELVVIVRSKKCLHPFLYNWVWVSGHNMVGAYLSTTDQTIEQIADTIVKGGWDFQPNLTIALEDLT